MGIPKTELLVTKLWIWHHFRIEDIFLLGLLAIEFPILTSNEIPRLKELSYKAEIFCGVSVHPNTQFKNISRHVMINIGIQKEHYILVFWLVGCATGVNCWHFPSRIAYMWQNLYMDPIKKIASKNFIFIYKVDQNGNALSLNVQFCLKKLAEIDFTNLLFYPSPLKEVVSNSQDWQKLCELNWTELNRKKLNCHVLHCICITQLEIGWSGNID